MARYMLICRSVDPVPFGGFGDFKIEAVGFVRYFATKDEAVAFLRTATGLVAEAVTLKKWCCK